MNSDQLRRRVFDGAVADVLRAADGGALTGSLTLALCVLDYLAGFLADSLGKPKADGKDYEAIINNYMTKWDSRYCGQDIWFLRNILVHTYSSAVSKPVSGSDIYRIAHGRPAAHLHSSTELWVNVDTFVTDAILSVDSFLRDHHGDTKIEQGSQNLLSAYAMSDDAMLNRPYSSFHRALRAFDLKPDDPGKMLRDDVATVYAKVPLAEIS